MKIGLIADTQVPSAQLSPTVKSAFSEVEFIVHAGDILIPRCLDFLEEIAPVKAVETGAERQFSNDTRVTEHHRVIEAETHLIGVVHELSIPGISSELISGVIEKNFPDTSGIPTLIEGIFGQSVNIVVFGMTHIPMVEEHSGILFVNPGSATWPNQRVMPGTVGILELTKDSRNVQIVDLSQLD